MDFQRDAGLEMGVNQVNRKEFKDLVAQDGIFVADFYAEWCGPCQQFAPIFNEVSQENPDITFMKIDTEVEQSLSQEYEVTSIPTIVIIRNREIVYREAGALSKQKFVLLLNFVKDLHSVNKEIEAAG